MEVELTNICLLTFENRLPVPHYAGIFVSMATVFDRLTLLGLPYDKHKISAAGESVSAYFISKDSATSYARIKVDQLEPVGTVRVWCYNDEYDSVIDGILINLYKPKRKRING